MPKDVAPSRAESIVSALVSRVRAAVLADGEIDVGYFDGWVRKNRKSLVQAIETQIVPLLESIDAGNDASDLPELWTKSKRTKANLAAMDVIARIPAERMTDADRRIVAQYSGWGGLSIREVAERFPAGIPHPDPQGLIHEFYTPSRVAKDVAAMLAPLLDDLVPAGERIVAVEPSAGIGRFVRAMQRGAFERVDWTAIEYSDLSATMLKAVAPSADVFVGPFERWIRDLGAEFEGRVNLFVSNPPYGQRGASKTEDPVREYRENMAYRYFMRRGVSLLAPNGIAVFLVPSGFMTSKTEAFTELRRKILLRAHLAAAFRLPSVGSDGREALFPGAMLVTDLIILRGRGGTLEAIAPEDDTIVAGDYYRDFPTHVLGREVGRDAGDDDQTSKPRWGYQIQGDYKGLPRLVERPICGEECRFIPTAPPKRGKGRNPAPGATGRMGAVRTEQDVDLSRYSEPVRDAVKLGGRVDRYLAAVAEELPEAQLLWPELVAALRAWAKGNGNPAVHVELVTAARSGIGHAARFLSAFDKTGDLIAGLQKAPPKPAPVFSGRLDDVAAQAEVLYRANRGVALHELRAFHASLGGRITREAIDHALLSTGRWFMDTEPNADQLVPAEDYLTGSLWPKVDRAMKMIATLKKAGEETAAWDAQVKRLMMAIAPAVYDDIEGVSARQGWVPLELVSAWINDTYVQGYYEPIELERKGGLVSFVGRDYEDVEKKDRSVPLETVLLLGWINHDKSLFSPPKKNDSDNEKDIDKIRVKKAAEWDASFKGWCDAKLERRILIEHAYNRQFRGFVPPTYTAESLPVARWVKEGIRPNPHQVAGARRVEANRGGLVAFDVGVGKTLTGILIMARARQEGWAKRPVILVPNTVAMNWYEEIARVLPDYRVGLVGVKPKVISRGDRKGQESSDTDTPEERAAKWTKLQTGEFDAIICTYSAFPRTRLNEKAVRAYADHREAIQREIKLRQRNAAKKKKLSEREEAILREGVTAWVAEKLELPEDWQYDPGIAWDDIGVDLLIVDEAQNFKNLYLPEDREGGVPRFMGNPGEGSNRAWQLDFRCAAIRQRTGGKGIVLLSATPAKNSPLEFYNLIQYIDPDAWTRMGIHDPEQFIDRYLKIEIQPIVTPTMEVEERGAVVGFTNLHELRDVIFRYGEFKTAEDVGLRLPEPTVKIVEVDMNAAQDEKYDRYVRQIEASLKSTDPSDKAKILGLLARMALVAIHPELDESYSWETAGNVADASAPKFEAVAANVLANRNCGHIVFVDNVAAHRWIKDTLVASGIAAERIAILNAKTAKAPADRQRIAKEFNGNPAANIAPKYDVVIANAVAYEGINLQTRTCAIHHVDLPWEPATLQQRNGRGVRQGNTLANIAIYYYFSRRSQDGLRFNLIQGKRGWMTQLIKSQDRDTNNPGAQTAMGPEEILLLISRNPEATRRQLEAVREQRRAEALKKLGDEATKLLRSINARYRNAERVRDPEEAARLRGEAEVRIKQLVAVDPEAWPWARWVPFVRSRPLLVTKAGAPLYEGLRVGIPSPFNAAKTDYAEFGRVEGGKIGLRGLGEAGWRELDANDARLEQIRPEHFDANWPDADADLTMRAAEQVANDRLRYSGDWKGLRWDLAPDEWVERAWAMAGSILVRAMAKVSYYNANAQRLPVLTSSGLRVMQASNAIAGNGEILAPTNAGWRTFLEAAPASGMKFAELDEAGRYWWNRSIPRNLLSAARGEGNDEADEAA